MARTAAADPIDQLAEQIATLSARLAEVEKLAHLHPPGSDTNPTGTFIVWAGAGTGAVCPTGYLVCDGTTANRIEHAALFGVIGTKYGAGDGSTTFGLPNGATGAVLAMIALATNTRATTLATTTESATHTHTTTLSNESATHVHTFTTGTESANHTHTFSDYYGSSSTEHTGKTTSTQSANHTHSGTTATESATHTHTATVGNASVTHTHSLSIVQGVLLIKT